MKRLIFSLVILALISALLPFRSGRAGESKEGASRTTQKRRLDYRVHPFADLFFYVYRFSSGSDKAPEVEGLAQSVEAARQLPLVLTLVDQLPFELENSAAAEKAFSQLPENYKTKRGEDVALRAKATRLGQSLVAFEEPRPNNNSATFELPRVAAQLSGVSPQFVCASISAPASSNCRAISA